MYMQYHFHDSFNKIVCSLYGRHQNYGKRGFYIYLMPKMCHALSQEPSIMYLILRKTMYSSSMLKSYVSQASCQPLAKSYNFFAPQFSHRVAESIKYVNTCKVFKLSSSQSPNNSTRQVAKRACALASVRPEVKASYTSF